MKIMFCTDIHGSKERYKKILDIHKEFDLTIIGGDILPKTLHKEEEKRITDIFLINSLYGMYEESTNRKGRDLNNSLGNMHECELIKKQKEFIKNLPDYFNKFKTPLIIDFANDDRYCNYLDFTNMVLKYDHIYNIHLKESIINGVSFIGMNCVPDYPFRLKDWCRSDNEDFIMDKLQFIDPFTSKKSGMKMIKDLKKHFNQRLSIEKILSDLLPGSMSKKSVYLFHSPPRDIGLDMVRRYKNKEDKEGYVENVGSRAITKWILDKQPKILLSGHVHESPEISGCYFNKLGNTLCIQPGQSFKSSKLTYCSFELDNIETTLELKTI